MELPPGVMIKVSGQLENDDEMFTSLLLALGLSVLFVYMILASQFGSFVHPFTIMSALPLSMVGVFLALFASGFNFDMLAMIGSMSLMGLVDEEAHPAGGVHQSAPGWGCRRTRRFWRPG